MKCLSCSMKCMCIILLGISSSSDLQHLVEESQIMSRFDHPNVMKLLGVSISMGRTLYVIMPFMAQGSLLSYLRKNRADLTVENEDMVDLVSNRKSNSFYGLCTHKF